MELAINILNNSLRKNKKILKRYKLDDNNVAYNNILKDVLTLEKAIKMLKVDKWALKIDSYIHNNNIDLSD